MIIMDKKAFDVLSKDPVLKKIIDKALEFEFKVSKNLYEAICEAIIGQQLSGKAATAIENKFLRLFDSKSFPKPQEVLEKSDQDLRNCGLSWQKVNYLKNLSEAVINKNLDFNKIKLLPDEQVIEMLTKVKGIGRWTAEMILIFHLGREDVFSVGDLGLRIAVSKLYNVARNDLKAIEKISQNWRPYRSWASRFLWKYKDND